MSAPSTGWGRKGKAILGAVLCGGLLYQIVAKAPVSDEAILYADLDLDALEDHRRIWPFFP